MTIYEIPLSNTPQRFIITMAGVDYQLTLQWCWPMQAWVLNFSTPTGEPILHGVPLVTGVDLLEQFGYLNFNGVLLAQTDFDPQAVPTFDNLGTTGHAYFITA